MIVFKDNAGNIKALNPQHVVSAVPASPSGITVTMVDASTFTLVEFTLREFLESVNAKLYGKAR